MESSKATRLIEAARSALKECLQGVEPVLLVFDQYGLSLADAFLGASQGQCNEGLIARYAMHDYQEWCADRRLLPPTLLSELSTSQALVTALTADPRCTWFRAELIKSAVEMGLRVIHMPGVDDELFVNSLLGVDLYAIQESGVPLQKRLAGACHLEIITKSRRGEEHRLKAEITGRPPHLCGGIVLPKDIMNLPTGEVYIAPLEDATNGTLVLNGTTGDRVLRSRDEIVLGFTNGHLDLARSFFSDTLAAQEFSEELHLIQQADPNQAILCEIGIGLNPAIQPLRGQGIWDEKALGSAHIALGANQPFGGKIQVNFHRDLIFYPEQILVDSTPVQMTWGRTRT